MNIKSIIKSTKLLCKQHKADILLYTGISGVILSMGLVAVGTSDAIRVIDDEIKDRNDEVMRTSRDDIDEKWREAELIEDLSNKDKVKVAWKCYIPAAITATTSIGCIIYSNCVQNKQKAALVVASSASQAIFEEYKNRVIEKLGSDEEKKIYGESVSAIAERKREEANEDIKSLNNDRDLCHDSLTGRYFYSTKSDIENVVNKLNRQLNIGDSFISLNEFYGELDIEPIYPLGNRLGWNINKPLDVCFDTIFGRDNKPCIEVCWNNEPFDDYQNIF